MVGRILRTSHPEVPMAAPGRCRQTGGGKALLQPSPGQLLSPHPNPSSQQCQPCMGSWGLGKGRADWEMLPSSERVPETRAGQDAARPGKAHPWRSQLTPNSPPSQGKESVSPTSEPTSASADQAGTAAVRAVEMLPTPLCPPPCRDPAGSVGCQRRGPGNCSFEGRKRSSERRPRQGRPSGQSCSKCRGEAGRRH